MTPDLFHVVSGLFSGVLVGFTLGLIGGGGSILAVPLMVYLVGVRDPHVAIGTSALGVAANAVIGLVHHARQKTVRWGCAAIFAPAGMIGALIGAAFGKAVNGQRLLLCFALLMLVVGALMLRGRRQCSHAETPFSLRDKALKIGAFGGGAGVLAGFFGIGGGFLIVPGLIAATDMPILSAIGTSLVAVAAFGFSTAASYTSSGYVDWPLAGLLVLGGAAGSYLGARVARSMAGNSGRLTTVFAAIIFVVAAYMIWRSMSAV